MTLWDFADMFTRGPEIWIRVTVWAADKRHASVSLMIVQFTVACHGMRAVKVRVRQRMPLSVRADINLGMLQGAPHRLHAEHAHQLRTTAASDLGNETALLSQDLLYVGLQMQISTETGGGSPVITYVILLLQALQLSSSGKGAEPDRDLHLIKIMACHFDEATRQVSKHFERTYAGSVYIYCASDTCSAC